jgi:2-polyprenyl-3-methyl-5-hydroxy-6-metoxy-1,4-benzoquinol methylase
MSETVKNCLLCSSNKSSIFDERELHGYQVVNNICSNCGFVYMTQRMSGKELNDFYKDKYRTLYQGQEEPTTANLKTQTLRADDLQRFAQENTGNVDRFLDIGASAGLLMEAFQKNTGSEVIGLELGDSYRKFAQDKGLTLYASLEKMQKAGEENFDLISMSHVLEHIPNPKEYLLGLRDSLNEGGFLLLQVPNLFWHDSFEVAHLISFSPHTLQEMVRAAGYLPLSIKSHGYPISKLFPIYTTILARKEDIVNNYQVKKESFVKPRRKINEFLKKVFGRLLPKLSWVPRE